MAHATVITRDDGVICGQPWFDDVFHQLDPGISITWHIVEGSTAAAGSALCEVRGPARAVLTGERTALNFLQTLSATATAAQACVAAIAGTRTQILDTRKTIPGLRSAQKYAVRVGGATNHRMGLFDAILIKENHIIAAGGIARAISEARRCSPGVLLEVEVESLSQAVEAFSAGPDRLLLDNFPLERLREAVRLRDSRAPKTTLEASGGITLATLPAVAATGVDFISMGSITKDLRALDLSMRFRFLGG
jgi:nicotinate-nucleotide pyrophosphorylase (carboxylating)